VHRLNPLKINQIGKMIFEYRSWNIENGSYILAGDRQTTARQQCRIPDKADGRTKNRGTNFDR